MWETFSAGYPHDLIKNLQHLDYGQKTREASESQHTFAHLGEILESMLACVCLHAQAPHLHALLKREHVVSFRGRVPRATT